MANQERGNDSRGGGLSRWLVIATLVLSTIAGLGAWMAYEAIGKTPGELLDYADRRLQGHDKLVALTRPLLNLTRDWFDSPPIRERLQRPFAVPPPPALKRLAPSAAGANELHSQPEIGRVLRVGPGEAISSIAEAARLARDGDTVEIAAGEYFGDVAVWYQKKLRIRGVGGNARLHAAGKSAEGKAIWVIRNGDFEISNIDFIGARVRDRNGAGIRFENGRLRVRGCLFWGGENGILTSWGKEYASAELIVENSEFAYNGAGDGLSHNLYVGGLAALKVTGSYFHHANVGHLIKSRARQNEIAYNRFTDESGGRASYEMDFPNGGEILLLGNIVQQNRSTENSTMISVGEEGELWPNSRLYLSNNTLVNEHSHGGAFVRVFGIGSLVVSENNILIGKGKIHSAGGLKTVGDVHAGWEIFERASRYDYRLSGRGLELRRQGFVDSAESRRLEPTAEYHHPHRLKSLVSVPLFPGALQSRE